MEVAPVFLKDVARIEGLLCLVFLALLVRALIEREIRQAMRQRPLAKIAIYPEDRGSSSPTATHVFALLSGLSRHRLFEQDRLLQVLPPDLTPLQPQMLGLLGVPPSVYLG